MGGVHDTLLLPFERGILPEPGAGGSWLFFNASPLPGNEAWFERLACEQPFKPDFDALVSRGYDAAPSLDFGGTDGALLLAGRSRRANERMLARAWNALKTGAPLIVAGAKTSGIAPLQSYARQLAGNVESLSKNHAKVFWCFRSGNEVDVPPACAVIDGFSIPAGGFSADGPDAASVMLAGHFGSSVTGRVADLGAGWGYLSQRLLAASPAVDAIDLFEADHRALDAARTNIADPRARFQWTDLTRDPPKGPYDLIVMNPPFHQGRASDPALGQTFIRAASRALPRGGRLLMVANRNLPYEATLDQTFARWKVLEESRGFKIFDARR